MGVEQLRALEEADQSNLPELVYVIAQARRVASYLDLCLDGPINALRHCVGTAVVPAESQPVDGLVEPLTAPVGALASLLESSSGDSPVPDLSSEQARSKPRSRPSPAGRAWRSSLAAIALAAGLVSAGVALWRHGVPIPLGRTTPSAPPATPASANRPSAPGGSGLVAGTLLLRASEPSWLEVRTPSGEPLHYGLLEGQQRFANSAGLEVRAGRPDLITVTGADGTSRTLGSIEDLRWWLIQPDGRIVPAPDQQG